MIKKSDLINIFDNLNISVSNTVTNEEDINVYPRIVFFEYMWESEFASGAMLIDIVTYQISFFSKTPRDKKLIELRRLLEENGVFSSINHEYVESDRVFHSFLSIEIEEDLHNE